jgi:hypothetical protein
MEQTINVSSIAAHTLAFAVVQEVVQRLKPENAAPATNVDTLIFNAVVGNKQ